MIPLLQLVVFDLGKKALNVFVRDVFSMDADRKNQVILSR